MENKFKYRPEVKSIEDLQPGDEFLVGDERWEWHGHIRSHGVVVTADQVTTKFLLKANVPIERDIPYPEGGAEMFRMVDGDEAHIIKPGTLGWNEDRAEWVEVQAAFHNEVLCLGGVLAIPKAKPQDKAKPAPKEYTVRRVPATEDLRYVLLGIEPADSDGKPLKPGDRVTVQRVEK
jgi:hypothetical protein